MDKWHAVSNNSHFYLEGSLMLFSEGIEVIVAKSNRTSCFFDMNIHLYFFKMPGKWKKKNIIKEIKFDDSGDYNTINIFINNKLIKKIYVSQVS